MGLSWQRRHNTRLSTISIIWSSRDLRVHLGNECLDCARESCNIVTDRTPRSIYCDCEKAVDNNHLGRVSDATGM